MMELDEAIRHTEQVAEEKMEQAGFDTDNERYRMSKSEKVDCLKCAEEHRQLAEWLKELKRVRELPWLKELKELREQKRPHGEWIIIDDCEHFIAKCSVCGRIEDSRMVKYYSFCRCGADMREKEGESN